MKILVIKPDGVNYYYEIIADRVSEALQNLGHQVTLAHLKNTSCEPYDLCLIVNIAEIIQGYASLGYGSRDDAAHCLQEIHQRSAHCCVVLMECLKTAWYFENHEWCASLQINHIIDLGYHHQKQYLLSNHWSSYSYLFNGLTYREQDIMRQMTIDTETRPIPWSMIGVFSQTRATLALRLVEHYDSKGFLYLKHQETAQPAVLRQGPHINYEQLMQIQRRSVFSVWCSHHNYFYMESERFRLAALSGSIPIKIMLQPIPNELNPPFTYLMFDHSVAVWNIKALDTKEVLRRMTSDYLNQPTLEDGFKHYLDQL
jgi:hypothetical protein